ncbi:MAG: hypothetical protein CVT67_04600 [Actinobacteria bacterium HGW-Actinobacteria-7]|nr:MAG: hypothetical protein CVT67_04600 [Actinobacteria bacterium HGW-Actinobacteria-7]
MMHYAPLTDVSPRAGLLSVVFASLEDAGFEPVIECDSRGWMHWRGWPQGSLWPTTIWVPAKNHAEARAFLGATFVELGADDPLEEEGSGFWRNIHRWSWLIYSLWLALLLPGVVAL